MGEVIQRGRPWGGDPEGSSRGGGSRGVAPPLCKIRVAAAHIELCCGVCALELLEREGALPL